MFASAEAEVVLASMLVVVEVVIAVSGKVVVVNIWVVTDCGEVGGGVLIADDGIVVVVVTVVVVVEGVDVNE